MGQFDGNETGFDQRTIVRFEPGSLCSSSADPCLPQNDHLVVLKKELIQTNFNKIWCVLTFKQKMITEGNYDNPVIRVQDKKSNRRWSDDESPQATDDVFTDGRS